MRTTNAAFGTQPCLAGGPECKFATSTLSALIGEPGLQVLRVEPSDETHMPWFVRAPDDDDVWPCNLECPNRAALLAEPKTEWVVTSFPLFDDAVSGTNGVAGDCGVYGDHHYPSAHDTSENCFRTSRGGIRSTVTWGSGANAEYPAGTLSIRDAP